MSTCYGTHTRTPPRERQSQQLLGDGRPHGSRTWGSNTGSSLRFEIGDQLVLVGYGRPKPLRRILGVNTVPATGTAANRGMHYEEKQKDCSGTDWAILI